MIRIATAVLTAACLFALVASCTRENAAFCCTSPEDCAAKGVDEDIRPCADGLACVANSCVAASCASAGCAAAAPVCEVASDMCVGCSDSSDCARFAGTGVCDPVSSACVECSASTDCDPAKPVCDGNACRACTRDSECPSGACADDGACVLENAVVYVSPQGMDAAPCSQGQPCKRLQFAIAQTSNARAHIVMATGEYVVSAQPIMLSASTTSAATLSIHGGNSRIEGPTSSDGLFVISHPAVIRDLEIDNPVGSPLQASSTVLLERIKVRGLDGLTVGGNVTMRDIDVRVERDSVAMSSGSISFDRGAIKGGMRGIVTTGSPVIDVKNVIISGTDAIGLDLVGASGSVSFVTVVNAGLSGTGATGLRCSAPSFALTISASIIWNILSTARPSVEGACQVSASIIGPTGYSNNMNTDPGFADVSQSDYRLGALSPARDRVDTGPGTDFEHDARPRGARFDLGADEAP
ncbi:MAG: hypothetical protein JWP01_3298 [Myxococcales bacterium]|nr:hypothetical protein [Myxococcales bacterium]